MRDYKAWVIEVMNRQLREIDEQPEDDFEYALWWMLDVLKPMELSDFTDKERGHTFPTQVVEVFGVHDTAVSLLRDLYAGLFDQPMQIYVAVDDLKGEVEGVLELEGNAFMADYFVLGLDEYNVGFRTSVNLYDLTAENEEELKDLYERLCSIRMGAVPRKETRKHS